MAKVPTVAEETAVASRILLVEDEEVLLGTFRDILEREGHQVREAPTGEEARKALEEAFDLILVDIVLPGMDGIDVLREIKNRQITSPVVMITGWPDVKSAAECLRLGAFDYITKPVERSTLVRVAGRALAHRSLEQERDRLLADRERYRQTLEAVFSSIREGIVTVDASMGVLHINPAAERICEVSRELVMGRNFRQVGPPGMECLVDLLSDCVRGRKPQEERQVEVVGESGESKTLEIGAVPLRDQHGAFQGAVLVLRDISHLIRLRQEVEGRYRFHNLIGRCKPMRELYEILENVAASDSTVLIQGESGTGKELVAAALHYSSARSKGPFMRVNCTVLSENLLESELFGHVKGSFTGAVRDKKGRFEVADGGTIFLDEVGDMSPLLQLKLLRVLQEREFERVGGTTTIKVDVRVIAATNSNLKEQVRRGVFRPDLYYRLNVVLLQLPPLRERKEDIPLLVDHLRTQLNQKLSRKIRDVAPEVQEIFMRYHWPGNVRELENFLERAINVCRGDVIQADHLPQEITAAIRRPPPYAPGDMDGERERVQDALRRTGGNKAKAARLLQMDRKTLYRKLRTLGITPPTE